MAKYRLLSAHYLEIQDGTQSVYLEGDKESVTRGEFMGTVVGDGTPYRVKWPTLEMEPLDDEAREMIAREEKRLADNQGVMNPVDDLPIGPDNYEKMYIPGFEGRQRRTPLPDGASIAVTKVSK